MKKALFIVAVIVLLIMINGLIHSIFDLWQKQGLLSSAQKRLEAQKLKNSRLKAELSYVKSDEFIEETAHNKLFLVKPGEQQVILEEAQNQTKKVQTTDPHLSNWQKWVNLLF